MRHQAASKTPSQRVALMRKWLALTMLISLFVVYLIWTSDDIIQHVSAPASHPLINDTAFVCGERLSDTRIWLYDVASAEPSTFGDRTTTPTSTSGTTPATSATATAPPASTSAPPTIYFVTPTYPRREQIAELTRLGQTLMHVPHLHWIVADDYDGCNRRLGELLDRFGMPYTLLASPMDAVYRTQTPIPRGVANRRAALRWIRDNGRRPGVLYFGDDDNTFDLRLFGEIRQTRRVSMFPVGLIGMYSMSAPVVKEGRVIGFYDSWPAKRQWPVDMAGFAVSLDFLARSPNATMPYRAGYEEDEFLKSIDLRLTDIEPRASNCTEVLVWHTQTKREKAPMLRLTAAELAAADRTSVGDLLRSMDAMGVSRMQPHHGSKVVSMPGGGVVPQMIRDGRMRSFGAGVY